MPKVKGPDGIETEMSMEELLQLMQSGEVSIRQDVHHGDGSVTSSVIYGNDMGDGIDHSVNLFGTMEDILHPVLARLQKEKKAGKNAEDLRLYMDNSGADYEITVDDTKLPIMHIVTCTKEKICIKRYIRDERKSTGKSMEEKEYAFVNGKMTATVSEIQADSLLVFVFGVYEIRKLLEARGLLGKLRELGNRGAGVLVTTAGDTVSTKIVQGSGRPDLPCMLFGGTFSQSLDDAVMMRPYLDEHIPLRREMSLEDKIKAAENGDPDRMAELAVYYLGEGPRQDGEKAAYWYRKLAEDGNPTGMYQMGMLYAIGFGVERDFAQAASWMDLAAENGDADAAGMAEEFRKAAVDWEKLSAGDAQAQADTAAILMELAGCIRRAGAEDDYKTAFDLARKSAAQNNPDGLWTLALAYEHGRGVEADTQKAIECYRKGAELGHAPCQHSYGCFFMRGEGVKQDYEQGFGWIRKSAEQGYGLGMKSLGACYQFGNGVKADMDQAMEWFEKYLETNDDPELENQVRSQKTGWEIRKKRKQAFEEAKKKLEAKYEQECALARKNTDRERARQQKEEKRLQEQLAQKRAYLESLGFFQFSEKKQTKTEINGLEQSVAEVRQTLSKLETSLEERISAQKRKLEEELTREQARIKESIRPKGLPLAEQILFEMEPGKQYSAEDLRQLPGVPEELTAGIIVERVLPSLISAGRLRVRRENKRTRYSLPE